MSLSEEVRTQIQTLIAEQPAVLFMKGTKRAPECGFSATVVQILDSLGVDYGTVDVMQAPEIRAGIKEFSAWPTVPQLYVNGEFVGGCDILREMFESGELKALFETPA